ncbi:RnfABCDGE type electron transport complex subunit D [Candidatus Saccharibacteria bacterium]|nr:RnfABCDGE type electron transport complex subunit D [Candidatus Saccharibacteria bacterium]
MTKLLSASLNRFNGSIDRLTDRFTSYRLVLYILFTFVGWAAVAGLFSKQIPYTSSSIVLSAGWLVLVCWLVNKLLATFFNVPSNKESHMITALILALIMTPASDVPGFGVLAGAALAAMASKYVLTFRKSHLFNPAAFGAFVSGALFHEYASWWVGTKLLTPLVFIGAILILRKIKRFQMVGLFLAVFLLYLIFGTSAGGDLHFLWLELIATQVLFFAVIMLTEPLTSPATARYYLPYALLVGLLYSVSRFKLSPEQALLLGNIFTFIFAANRRYELKFVRRVKEAEGIYSYVFSLPKGFRYLAGQYMEWTLSRNKSDSRGNRRYLTVSSAPTEQNLMITVKEPPKPSTFKQQLASLKPGDKILASRLAGGFTLPSDSTKKLAFMAGGVGITPYRSMIKAMIDDKQNRDTALIYSANSDAEVSFRDLFAKASDIGLKSHYITDGQVDGSVIKKLLPDYRERTFFVSGPYGYVNAMESNLIKLGVGMDNIVTDYFPGYG